MCRTIRPGAAAGLLAALLAGCVRQPPPLRPALDDPPRGEVTFTALADISAPRPRDASTEEVLPPVAIEGNQPPIYPPRPLAAGHGPATVVVRLIIGAYGRVEQVTDSPLMESAAGPFSDDFRAAVETAIRGWAFTPARWRQLGDGEDYDGDGKPDYRKVLRSEPIPVYIDVRFDFRIVDGRGVVTIN